MNDGGPAFPFKTEHIYNDGDSIDTIDYSNPGMSLRDWFAGMALQSGLCPVNTYMWGDIAEWCGHIADAMIKEREK